ncbi:MAG: hypothetical protein C5B53_10160 [Candidatus Melainabacteria bacterium]|nr:MAG: hypothetical protein C5B53_10160 [Candidatus Melainabacteria bacterium]
MDLKTLITDLKLSPEIKSVRRSRRSLIIEHNNDQVTHDILEKIFPNLRTWSDRFDAGAAKLAELPSVNKGLPFALLAMAAFAGWRDKAFLAGESAFALIYLAFDLYWKLQQENLMIKIQNGLSTREREQLEVMGPSNNKKQ